jgi:hypothetical protein
MLINIRQPHRLEDDPDAIELHRLLLAARDTNRSLHRRTQAAESAAAAAWTAGWKAARRDAIQQREWILSRMLYRLWRNSFKQ